MGDDDEARRGQALHLFQHAAEAIDVGVVERRIDFVQHAERRGVGEEDREDERGRRERLFAAGEEREVGEALAGRLGEDFEAGFERIVAFGEP